MKTGQPTKILRLKLTDFLGTDIEEYVVFALEDIRSILPFQLNVNLWYRSNDCLCPNKLLAFRKSNQPLLDNYNVQFIHLNGYENTAWYDIIHEKDMCVLSKFYFRLTYVCPTELPVKLIEFKNFIMSYGAFKNEKYSNNRIPKLAGSN